MLFLSIITFPCLGQVATPSLDNILLIDMAAATGWRHTSTSGMSLLRGLGTENKDSSDKKTISWNEVSYLISSHVTGGFYTEAFRSMQRRELSGNNDQKEKYEINRTQVNFAFKVDKLYSIGGSYFSSENKLESDSSDTFYNEVKEEQTGVGLGGSVRLFKQIFVAGGLEYTEEKSTSKSNQNKVIKSDWLAQLYGVAFVDDIDKPTVRVEYSKIISPEVKSSNLDSTSPTQYSSDNTRLAIEVIPDQIEALFRFERQSYVENISSDEKIERIFDSYGVSKILKDGWSIGFYLISGKETTSFAYSDNSSKKTESAKTTNYRLNIAFNF